MVNGQLPLKTEISLNFMIFSTRRRRACKKPAKAEKTQKNVVESHEEKIAQMLSDYAAIPLEKMDESVSFFWKNMAQGDKYEKAFSEVTKKWLTPPPSSVDERLFSTAGNVTPDKRKAMLPFYC